MKMTMNTGRWTRLGIMTELFQEQTDRIEQELTVGFERILRCRTLA